MLPAVIEALPLAMSAWELLESTQTTPEVLIAALPDRSRAPPAGGSTPPNLS